jgi:hypothetical protein
MFWGEGLFVFPLMLIYTVISYLSKAKSDRRRGITSEAAASSSASSPGRSNRR